MFIKSSHNLTFGINDFSHSRTNSQKGNNEFQMVVLVCDFISAVNHSTWFANWQARHHQTQQNNSEKKEHKKIQ